MGRAQTAMSFHPPSQPANTRLQRANTTRARPQTAMSSRNVEEDSTSAKQNCTVPPFSQSQSHSGSIHFHKIRTAASLQSVGIQASTSKRDVSISTMMGNLSLDDERAYDSLTKRSQRSQVISAKENFPPSQALIPLRPPSDPMGSVTFRRSRREDTAVDLLPRRENSEASMFAPPMTPRSHSTQDAQQMLENFGMSLLASTRKYTGSPSKSSSQVRSFLTKDSNTRAFTAWDMDERLIEVEAQFKAMKEVMNVSLSDKKAMEEVIDMAKTRGMQPRQPIHI